ncbi:MAG: alpha-ketoglutarate-dependent dioxygenase AlkB [Rhodospirillaceae bacterium]|nr:alpha-ketoglutarate-dependent dioxygenase AlkB [Rhodospirillaceae bacterium]
MTRQSTLFEDLWAPELPPGFVLQAQALSLDRQKALLAAVRDIEAIAPLSRLRTKGGGLTSAAMTNCGDAGWWSDAKGYRYETTNPATGAPWPAMPPVFWDTVREVAGHSPWPDFEPDACLINFYTPAAKMGLHQDRDEKDFKHPIITVCLGDDADFQVGGALRTDKYVNVRVHSGDVLLMGGESRMRFHGVRKIFGGTSPIANVNGRYSLTFRKAL